MPFVTQAHRDNPDPSIPGDRTFLWYKRMIDMWRADPRWTTADYIYDFVRTHEDTSVEQGAKELAWQVFFQLHVMPYEQHRRKENGDI